MIDRNWPSYVEGFRDSIVHWISPGLEILDHPGVVGYLGTAEQPRGRIVITDDRAADLLEDVGDPFLSVASVHPTATRSHAHLAQLDDYEANLGTAMVIDNLANLPSGTLDLGLSLRRAALHPADGESSLSAAAGAFFSFEPPAERSFPAPDAFAQYLSSIPNATILTATDDQGTIRATAGSAVFGQFARVFFVSTDPTYRGRGIGTAMTATVVRAARDAGAEKACLEASASGRSIYRRLGFTDAGPITVFVRY